MRLIEKENNIFLSIPKEIFLRELKKMGITLEDTEKLIDNIDNNNIDINNLPKFMGLDTKNLLINKINNLKRGGVI